LIPDYPHRAAIDAVAFPRWPDLSVSTLLGRGNDRLVFLDPVSLLIIPPRHPPPESEYLFHDDSIRVTRCGRICMGRRKINPSTVAAGQMVGIRDVDDPLWLVSFLDFDLGFFDREEGRVEPAPNPFAPEKVSTMSPE
jgi:putative transposase